MKSDEMIGALVEQLKQELPDDTVSVSVFVNSEGTTITIDRKSSEQLKNSGYSMKNIKGDFIK